VDRITAIKTIKLCQEAIENTEKQVELHKELKRSLQHKMYRELIESDEFNKRYEYNEPWRANGSTRGTYRYIATDHPCPVKFDENGEPTHVLLKRPSQFSKADWKSIDEWEPVDRKYRKENHNAT